MTNELDHLIDKATSGREAWLDVHHYGIMLDGTWNTGEEIEALAELLNYLVAKNKDKNGNQKL